MKEYRRLMADRPHKLGVWDVGFTTSTPDPQVRCGRCFHYFSSLVQQRSTCEIFKGRGADRKVPAGGSCHFFTRDGLTFPRLDHKTSTPPKGEDYALDSKGLEASHEKSQQSEE